MCTALHLHMLMLPMAMIKVMILLMTMVKVVINDNYVNKNQRHMLVLIMSKDTAIGHTYDTNCTTNFSSNINTFNKDYNGINYIKRKKYLQICVCTPPLPPTLPDPLGNRKVRLWGRGRGWGGGLT